MNDYETYGITSSNDLATFWEKIFKFVENAINGAVDFWNWLNHEISFGFKLEVLKIDRTISFTPLMLFGSALIVLLAVYLAKKLIPFL